MTAAAVFKVLFVCTGNICRSPSAEGVFRALIAREGLAGRVDTDSAGTAGYHLGEHPDPRSCEAAQRRGINIHKLRARRVAVGDFAAFDLVLAMDRGHHAQLSRLCPPEMRDRLRLFLDFAPQLGIEDVPDPYYGGQDGFERVLDMIEAGCQGILRHIRETAL